MTPQELLKMPLYERIAVLRKQNELSHDRLAQRLGTSRQVVIGWEKHAAQPSPRYVAALAEEFSLPPEVFEAPPEEDVSLASVDRRLREVEDALEILGKELSGLAGAVDQGPRAGQKARTKSKRAGRAQ